MKPSSLPSATAAPNLDTPASNLRRLPRSRRHVAVVSALLTFFCACGCTVLTYRGANGERFTRASFGAATAVSSLSVEAGTNGLRRVELRGYTNDSTQALGTVTEAAVRAALQGAK